MANRTFNQFPNSLEKKVVDLFLKASIGSTGAVTISAANSKGIRTIVRNSAGKYTITLQDTYYKFLGLKVNQLGVSGLPAAPDCAIVSQAVNAATPTLVIQFSVGGVATDPDSGVTVYASITLGDSSAF